MATPDTPAAPTPLAESFEEPSRDAWLALVDKALKGGDFEKRLVSSTADGIRIEPLYTRKDELAASQAALPGSAPFTRGLHAQVQGAGWDIRQLHANPDPAAINKAILTDLNAGVSSVTIQLEAPGQSGLENTKDALDTALKDVRIDWAPISFAPGASASELLKNFDAIVKDRGATASDIDCALNADPLGTLARTGTLPDTLDGLLKNHSDDIKIASDNYPKMRVALVDARIYHEAGATQGQELASLCATLVTYLRELEKHGIKPADALPRIAFALTAESDIFLNIAKLRAARRMIATIAGETGATEAVTNLHITATTSQRMMTKRDPWTNLLRTTTACASAAIGGADAITVLPFTSAMGRPDDFALRTARNIQLVCQEESSLGRVIDPAGGSWYIENLTDELAKTAWAQFQQIESEGGLVATLEKGALQARINEAALERVKRVATGKEPLTGTSTFPFLADDGVTAEPHFEAPAITTEKIVTPLTPHRLAEPYEQLRDNADAHKARTGAWPQVFLASLGAVADHTARSTWIKNLMAAGGIEAITTDGFENGESAAAAFKQSGAKIACICSSDKLYDQHALATLKALQSAGATHIYLAGRPRALEDTLQEAGLTTLLHANQNALEQLTALHAALGVKG